MIHFLKLYLDHFLENLGAISKGKIFHQDIKKKEVQIQIGMLNVSLVVNTARGLTETNQKQEEKLQMTFVVRKKANCVI